MLNNIRNMSFMIIASLLFAACGSRSRSRTVSSEQSTLMQLPQKTIYYHLNASALTADHKRSLEQIKAMMHHDVGPSSVVVIYGNGCALGSEKANNYVVENRIKGVKGFIMSGSNAIEDNRIMTLNLAAHGLTFSDDFHCQNKQDAETLHQKNRAVRVVIYPDLEAAQHAVYSISGGNNITHVSEEIRTIDIDDDDYEDDKK